MIDINRPWIGDTAQLSTRFPIYTRGNTGEVAAEVTSPMKWTTTGGWFMERQWRKALVDFGAFDEDEFRPDELDVTALIHGYIYMNLSVSRVFGVRMPGGSAELMDRAYLGESAGVRPYEAQPGDDSPEFTQRISEVVAEVLSATGRPDLDEDARRAATLRDGRPDLRALSDEELLERYHSVLEDDYADVLRKHLLMIYQSSVVTGLLQQALAGLGDPTLEVRLMGGWGGVASAAASHGLWDLSRLVRRSDVLVSAFEQGTRDLNDRLRGSSDSDEADFARAFDAFLYEFGSRSTDEWEAMPATWETHPHVALGLVDRMRLQPDDRSPAVMAPRVRREREELTEQLRTQLAASPEELATLEQALQAMSVWMPARELSKTNTVRVLQEVRLPLVELGRRYYESGVLAEMQDITYLTVDELGLLGSDPESAQAIIAERSAWKEALERKEPPFIVEGTVPSATSWDERSAPSAQPVSSGDILIGLGACSGTATGVARVIHDPEDAADLEPGEILVAPVTDPGWTPLFTSAEAVVVNVGSPLSHAAIVARELGIPAVLAVAQATKRIKDGMLITVDGTAGTVTIG